MSLLARGSMIRRLTFSHTLSTLVVQQEVLLHPNNATQATQFQLVELRGPVGDLREHMKIVARGSGINR